MTLTRFKVPAERLMTRGARVRWWAASLIMASTLVSACGSAPAAPAQSDSRTPAALAETPPTPDPAHSAEPSTDDCALRSEETAAIAAGEGFATLDEAFQSELSQLTGIDGELVAATQAENLATWELIRQGEVRGEIVFVRRDGLWNFESNWFCFPE